MDVLFTKNNNTFKMRVGCIIKNGDKILVTYDSPDSYRYLPGGKVEFGESVFDTVKREIKEELNIDVLDVKELFVDEVFYFSNFSNTNVHELCFYFEIKIALNQEISKDKFSTFENNRELYFEWLTLDEINKIDFRPHSVKDVLSNFPKQFEILRKK